MFLWFGYSAGTGVPPDVLLMSNALSPCNVPFKYIPFIGFHESPGHNPLINIS